MGLRKVIVRESVAQSIAEIAWYIESEGLIAAAEKFNDEVYDFINNLGDSRKSYRICREPQRNLMGYKYPSEKNILSFLLNRIVRLSYVSLFRQKVFIGEK